MIKNFLDDYVEEQKSKYDLQTIKDIEKEKKFHGQPSDGSGGHQVPYDPNVFREKESDGTLGPYDFTKAPGYDEKIVRHNLNKVLRPKSAIIKAPSLNKSVIVQEKPNYVEKN